MKKGALLWYDSSPVRTLTEKVRIAAKRYRDKTGRDANLCYAHSDIEAQTVDGIDIVPKQFALLNHLQVGEADDIEYGIMRDRDGIFLYLKTEGNVRRHVKMFDAKFRELFGRLPVVVVWSDRVITAGPLTEFEAHKAAEKLREEQKQ